MLVKELLKYIDDNDLYESEVVGSLGIQQHGVLACEDSTEYIFIEDIELLCDGRLLMCLGPIKHSG